MVNRRTGLLALAALPVTVFVAGCSSVAEQPPIGYWVDPQSPTTLHIGFCLLGVQRLDRVEVTEQTPDLVRVSVRIRSPKEGHIDMCGSQEYRQVTLDEPLGDRRVINHWDNPVTPVDRSVLRPKSYRIDPDDPRRLQLELCLSENDELVAIDVLTQNEDLVQVKVELRRPPEGTLETCDRTEWVPVTLDEPLGKRLLVDDLSSAILLHR